MNKSRAKTGLGTEKSKYVNAKFVVSPFSASVYGEKEIQITPNNAKYQSGVLTQVVDA